MPASSTKAAVVCRYVQEWARAAPPARLGVLVYGHLDNFEMNYESLVDNLIADHPTCACAWRAFGGWCVCLFAPQCGAAAFMRSGANVFLTVWYDPSSAEHCRLLDWIRGREHVRDGTGPRHGWHWPAAHCPADEST